jgi:lambda family phage tail tape measure protein
MADINVSLGLDDSKYKQGLTNAQNSATQLGQKLNQSLGQGVQGAQRLGQGIDGLNNKFQGLGRAIVALGLTAFVAKALQSADALSDLSAALGVNTARLMEMEIAALTANSNLEQLSGMIGRLEDNMQSAIDGNQKMRDSLGKLGIGFDEIQQLTPDQVFNRIAKALGEMTDTNQRAALATEVLGKAARSIDFAGYNNTIQQVTGTQDENAKAVEAAGKTLDSFAQSVKLVSAEVIKLISPLLSLLTPMDETGKSMDTASTAAKVLVGALAVFASTSIVSGIINIANSVRALVGFMAGSAAATATSTATISANTIASIANANAQAFLAGAAGRVGTAVTAVAIAEARYNAVLVAHGIASAQAIAADSALAAARVRLAEATAGAAATQGVLTGATQAGTAANVANAASGAGVLAWLGKYKIALTAVAAISALLYSSNLNAGEDEEIARMRKLGEEADLLNGALSRLTVQQRENYSKMSAAQKAAYADTLRQQEAQARLNDLQKKIFGETSASGGGYKATDEQTKAQQRLTDAINRQKLALADVQQTIQGKNQLQLEDLKNAQASLTLSTSEKAVRAEMLEFDRRAKSDLINLQKTLNDLTVQSASNDKDARDAALAQLPLVKQAIIDVTAEYERQRPVIEATAKAAQEASIAEQNRARLAEFSASQRVQAEQQVRAIQDDMAKMTMSEIEQKYYDIAAAAREAGIAQIESINAQRRAAKELELTEREKLEIMTAANQKANELRNITRRQYEASRTFSTGWKRAMNDYVSNVANAAKQAEVIFNRAMMGMEDAIVNFAKTGKFEWKNFVSMMLEELLRAQIQQVFAQLMGTMSGTMRTTQQSMLGGATSGGGNVLTSLLGSLGGLFGGSKPAYQTPGIIPTSSSGGLLSGITSVLGSFGSGITSAVSSIGKFFGGFFATGGTLGAGKWGIAGERGPELISGPATITPMGMGGATYVTYNINAVDSTSFQQLVARDPSFIYAVTEQGRRSVNGTRR